MDSWENTKSEGEKLKELFIRSW